MSSTLSTYLSSSPIDVTFPVSGVDNDVQGFRTNYQNIVGGLNLLSNEVTTIQAAANILSTEVTQTTNNLASLTNIVTTATTATIGLVKPDGVTITINSGTISANTIQYTLPIAGVTAGGTLGGVKVDGTTITINASSGVITAPYTYTLPTASTTVLGGVKVDGTTITVAGNGVISSTGGGTPLPSQSGNSGLFLTTNGSTLSWSPASSGVSLSSRTQAVYTTLSPLANGVSAAATVSAAKGYALYSITVSAGAWVTVYTSASAQTADSARSITTDPNPGSGVIAEAISTTGTTTYFTPAVFGFNADPSPNNTMYLKITNNSGSTTAITVTVTYLQLEV